MTGRPATPPIDTTQTSDDPQAIADDIRETRAELDETISAIGSKLDPSHLVDEAKEMFTSTARDAGASMLDQVKSSSVLDTIKDNPIPAMAVGLSVAWFLSKVGETESDRYRHERYRETGDPYYAPRARYGRGYDYGDSYAGRSAPVRTYGSGDDESILDKAKDAASDAVDAVKDTASDLGDKASNVADRATDALGGATGAAGDHARGAGHQLQRFERRAESWLDRQMQQNPLAVGAVALAAGALVGLSVPETDAEDRLMGEQAQAARQRLSSAASTATERVTSAAQDVADQAADKAKSVGKEAEAKAKEVGDKAEDRVDTVADSAKDDLKKATPGTGSSSGGSTAAGASPTSFDTGTSVDLSTTPDRPGAGTTAPPAGPLGTPTTTVDLTDDPASGV
ncbi:DUF3618 domain-containing protein [Rubrivirga sp.]|uniref:DUF3618 domain-containing protein n=1 Tax=Rubrivirga sp. TaxID=1885344 RepID=UPI003B52275B